MNDEGKVFDILPWFTGTHSSRYVVFPHLESFTIFLIYFAYSYPENAFYEDVTGEQQKLDNAVTFLRLATV